MGSGGRSVGVDGIAAVTRLADDMHEDKKGTQRTRVQSKLRRVALCRALPTRSLVVDREWRRLCRRHFTCWCLNRDLCDSSTRWLLNLFTYWCLNL